MIDLSLFLLFLIGFFSAFIAPMTPGIGFLSLTALLILGFEPSVAIALNVSASIGGNLTATLKYHTERYLDTRLLLPLIVPMAVGGLIGAYILLGIPGDLLKHVLGISMILMIFLIAAHQDQGIRKIKKRISLSRRWLGYGAMGGIGMWGGFMGSGFGPLSTVVLLTIFNKTYLETSALRMALFLFVAPFATIVYYQNGLLQILPAVVLFAGSALGAYLGVHGAIRLGNRWIRYITIPFLLLASIKLLFF